MIFEEEEQEQTINQNESDTHVSNTAETGFRLWQKEKAERELEQVIKRKQGLGETDSASYQRLVLEPVKSQSEEENAQVKPVAATEEPRRRKRKRRVTPQPEESQETTVKSQQLVYEKNATPENEPAFNSFPAYFYAGFWIRFFAFQVDLLCIYFISSLLCNQLLWHIGLRDNGLRLGAYSIIGLGIYLVYFILLTKLTNGQTIGKMIFGIQVVCFNEERLSWSTVLIREGACRFSLQVGILLVGYFITAFTPRKQHPGDFLSETSVITLNTVKASKGLIG